MFDEGHKAAVDWPIEAQSPVYKLERAFTLSKNGKKSVRNKIKRSVQDASYTSRCCFKSVSVYHKTNLSRAKTKLHINMQPIFYSECKPSKLLNVSAVDRE